MWTDENRVAMTEASCVIRAICTMREWAHVEPLLPPAKYGGASARSTCAKVVNDLLYVLGPGRQWRAIPKDLPPKSTVYDYFDLWDWDGTLDRIHAALYVKCREAVGREASPTAAIIDSQSVKSAKKGQRIDPSGYDADSDEAARL